MDISELKFARSEGVDIAYQCYGTGPVVINIPGLVGNVELAWEEEVYRRARHYVGKHIRMVEFDKRGIGASDRFEQAPTLEQRIGDIGAVMDAEGVERAHILGLSEGGVMAQFFAARHPERVDRLILVNSMAGLSASKTMQSLDETFAPSAASALANLQQMIDTWGRDPEHFVNLFAPAKAEDAAFVRWSGRFQRQTCTRADLQRQFDNVLTLDANDQLQDIQAPTLIMNVLGDRVIHPAMGRYLAGAIPGAVHVEFPGDDHMFWVASGWQRIMDRWLEFMLGHATEARTERQFATVLFTDIVGSTARSAQVGDEAWREMLDRHDRIALAAAGQHDGKLVKNTGDGLLMTFSVPSQGLACATKLVRELGSAGLSIRAGLHAGEILVREDGDVTGLAVNLAARVQELATGGSTWVSSTVHDLLLGGEWKFAPRGEHQLKGIDGAWRLHELAA
ncbi:MAG: class 3 adenylate cyclase [Hyphomicrobiaceae bacterium]|jgi:class 3 adenylate cyclase